MQTDELEPPFGIVARAPGCGYCRAMNRDDEKRIASKLARILLRRTKPNRSRHA